MKPVVWSRALTKEMFVAALGENVPMMETLFRVTADGKSLMGMLERLIIETPLSSTYRSGSNGELMITYGGWSMIIYLDAYTTDMPELTEQHTLHADFFERMPDELTRLLSTHVVPTGKLFSFDKEFDVYSPAQGGRVDSLSDGAFTTVFPAYPVKGKSRKRISITLAPYSEVTEEEMFNLSPSV